MAACLDSEEEQAARSLAVTKRLVRLAFLKKCIALRDSVLFDGSRIVADGPYCPIGEEAKQREVLIFYGNFGNPGLVYKIDLKEKQVLFRGQYDSKPRWIDINQIERVFPAKRKTAH